MRCQHLYRPKSMEFLLKNGHGLGAVVTRESHQDSQEVEERNKIEQRMLLIMTLGHIA